MTSHNHPSFHAPFGATCLGTQQVELRRRSGDHVTTTTTATTTTGESAMVAAFHCASDDENRGSTRHHLVVLVTDGKVTFQGGIHPEETKMNWERCQMDQDSSSTDPLQESAKVEILASLLLRDSDPNERISVSYDYEIGEDGAMFVKLVMRERLSTGLVRVLWNGKLGPIDIDLGALPFSIALGNCINEGQVKIKTLQQERDKLQDELQGWKDTAEKLDSKWQTEKDDLLDRFLQLYRKTHEAFGSLRQEMEQLKKQPSPPPPAMPEATVAKKKSQPPSAVFDHPDDNDVEIYDAETVERLARGPSRKTSSIPNTTVAPVASVGPPSAATRTNPHTGAIEVWDVEALFNDAALFGPPPIDKDLSTVSKRNLLSDAESNAQKRPRHQ